MSISKKSQKKIAENSRFSTKEKLVLSYRGEKREFKDYREFLKETGISGSVVKDIIEEKCVVGLE